MVWRKRKREREQMTMTEQSPDVRRAVEQRHRIERAEKRVLEQGEALPPLLDAFTAEVRRALRGRPA